MCLIVTCLAAAVAVADCEVVSPVSVLVEGGNSAGFSSTEGCDWTASDGVVSLSYPELSSSTEDRIENHNLFQIGEAFHISVIELWTLDSVLR